ncbi:CGNR zinc finger domain-containing protein [Actinomadura viridis]|uniref:RNA-binding Zn ribbon-like protein n=1 Tax=Actinomadura viridis TaxID=58110 RepID=A0A931DD67_9ACTN|nr:CGNR zinc finger domain-containing protein [Actinomadura viridis]MBG6087940.1 putative RNA-binding Zn ribbon-like protein [Actinomadura viridis]
MDGGQHPRPRAGSGASPAAVLLRDFVNTFDVESGSDAIGAPGPLAGWLADHDLVPRRTSADAADVETALVLREGLRAAMLGHLGTPPAETTPSAGDTPPAELEGAFARLPLRLDLSGDHPALVPLGTGTAAGLARLAAAVMESAADGSWSRLKVCQEGTCMWAFLDTSKNRSRSWCSMRVCGNRTKTRTYRARRRTARDGDREPGRGTS